MYIYLHIYTYIYIYIYIYIILTCAHWWSKTTFKSPSGAPACKDFAAVIPAGPCPVKSWMKSLYEAMTTQLHSYNYKYLREYYIYKYHEYHVYTILDVFGVSVHQLNPIFFGGPTSFHRRDRQVP